MSNTNAAIELIEVLKGKAGIKCATINREYSIHSRDMETYDYDNPPEPDKPILLKLGHTDEEYHKFLEALNFTYDAGYGGQELFGTVWLEDGTWLSRGEYDGSEWWNHHKVPEIPKELL